MEKEKYLEDLSEIRSIMDKSTRFISLSGLSGIIAGSLALIGAYLASIILGKIDYNVRTKITPPLDTTILLLTIAIVILVLSLGAGVFFSYRKAKKLNQTLWGTQSKRFLVNVFIPLATGGLVCLVLLFDGYIGLIAPLTLIFYGLALINGSKYTLKEIRGLGLVEIFLGLIGLTFVGYGLLSWAMGFGIMHIIYGIYMHLKYER